MDAPNYPQPDEEYWANRYAAFETKCPAPLNRAPFKTKRARPEKPPVPMTFEEAMQYLRRGRAIQRRAWNRESMIFALGVDVFLKLPASMQLMSDRLAPNPAYGSAPTFWRPYPADFLADDWQAVK